MPNGRVPVRQGGFTYIGLLLLIAIGGIGLAAVGQVWHTESQREREKELLFVGEQYARAIGSYYESTPGAVKQYPASLEELLEDRRFPVMRRHLRKLYRDPVTGEADWALILQQGRIVGVHSQSERKPIKSAGFPEKWAQFADAGSYREWKFTRAESMVQAGSAAPESAAGVRGEVPAGKAAAGGGDQPDGVDSGSGEDIYKRMHTCMGQRMIDARECAVSEYCKVLGPGSRCGLCRASILARYNACLKGVPPPPLDGG